MIKEALKYLADLQTPQRPVTVHVGHADYEVNADGTLGDRVAPPPPAYYKPIFTVTSLSSLAKLYISNLDQMDQTTTAVHIVDPFTVRLVTIHADEFGHRHVFAEATHQSETEFKFNAYYNPEPFLLAFRSSFLFDDNAVLVQKLCSTVTAGNAVSIADDGVSQQVTITEGTVTRTSTTLPSDGVALIPVRTFREANAVQSKFLLRMKAVKDAPPQIALFEIDTRWKIDTITSIRHYLESQLPTSAILLS